MLVVLTTLSASDAASATHSCSGCVGCHAMADGSARLTPSTATTERALPRTPAQPVAEWETGGEGGGDAGGGLIGAGGSTTAISTFWP